MVSPRVKMAMCSKALKSTSMRMPQSLALSRAGSISLRLRCLKPARSNSQAKSLINSFKRD